MKRLLTLALVAAMTGSVSAQKQQTLHSGYPIDPVPFTSVKVTDSFWGQRLKASREVTIPLAFSKCEETGRYENFVKATHPSDEYKVGGFSFDDTDVYKTIEGASYSLQTYPDKKLEEYIDSVLVIVAAAQEPDGYLYTARTMNPKHPHDWSGPERWSEVEMAVGLSILLIANTIGTPAAMAWLMASFVCGITLSSAATMMMAISVALAPRARMAVNASWPGVSRNVILRPSSSDTW